MPAELDDDKKLTEILEALANPVVRHFIELLALSQRAPNEFKDHFDLSTSDVLRVGDRLKYLGLAKREYNEGYIFNDEGLVVVQKWLDRINSVRSSSRKPPATV
jgi:hypothetical protein